MRNQLRKQHAAELRAINSASRGQVDIRAQHRDLFAEKRGGSQ